MKDREAARLSGAALLLSIPLLVGVACNEAAGPTLSATTDAGLEALGIADVSVTDEGYALFDIDGERVGLVVVDDRGSFASELDARKTVVRSDASSLALRCDDEDYAAAWVDGVWVESSGSGAAPDEACLRAVEAGRLIATDVAGEDALPEPQMAGCRTRTTWVWGTGNCDSCFDALPGGCVPGSTTCQQQTSCSDGWATTSCTMTACSPAI